jgi:predicted ATPase/class 3 adenylate cyclase
MPDLPAGTVTFLFTDIEGSTALWERDRPAMEAAVDRQFALLDTAISAHGGVRFKVVGDAVQAAFPTAPDAIAAALAAQRALLAEPWQEQTGPLRVRMALHTSAATPRDGDYLAPGLNRLARLLAAGHGGQVLVSLATQELARDSLPSGTTLRDLGEHPLRDLYRPERVFQLRHPDLPAEFPPLRTLATRPNNLPLQPTPFLGREEEVDRLVALLGREDVRLLTVTGPGGVGKTRLALQAAADLLEAFPNGVWFVDLTPLADPSLVLPAVGAVLSLRDGEVTTDRLAGLLGGKRMLLVLDNFERVLEAAPFVADLLARVPGAKVLVTSRIPLHAYGEQEYPLAPLPLPDPLRLPTLERLSQYDAVRLFVARARAVKPDFAVTDANAPAVAEICYRLDGLPLAIELAAARVKVLPPQALLKRLERRLPLLTGGARTLPARQQTMRDAIAWSHDLLSLDEQTLFRRLAIFPGGCTIDAAEAVGDPEGRLDLLGCLTSLVDESLMRQAEGTVGDPRFRMLATVREFGLDQLEASGERDEILQRLATWCLGLAEQAEPDEYFANISPGWVPRLDEEFPNLRAAVTWLLEHGEATRALRILAAAEDFWLQRHTGNVELYRWLEAALAAAPAAPARDRAIAHWLLSIGNGALGHDEAAMHHAQRLRDAAEEAGDSTSFGFAYFALAYAWECRGDVPRAAAAYAKADAAWEAESGEEFSPSYAEAELADKWVLQGNLEAGVSRLEELLTRVRQRTDPPWWVVLVVNLRGHAALRQGDLPRAAGLFAEAIDHARVLHHSQSLFGAMAGMAGVALARGESPRAARLLGAVEAARVSAGLMRIGNGLHVDRITADTRAAVAPAAFDQAWSAGRALTLEETVAEALTVAHEVAADAW